MAAKKPKLISKDEPLITEQQVADMLYVSVSVVRKWRALKRAPEFVKFGRSIRYEPEIVREFKRNSRG